MSPLEGRAAGGKCRKLAGDSIPHAETLLPPETSRTLLRTGLAREAGELPGSTRTSTACPGKCRAAEPCDRLLLKWFPEGCRPTRSWLQNSLHRAPQFCLPWKSLQDRR